MIFAVNEFECKVSFSFMQRWLVSQTPDGFSEAVNILLQDWWSAWM